MNRKRTGWKRKILHEMAEYWANVFYLAVFFSVFINYRRLILAHYQISYEDYGVAIINALVLAKVILVAEGLHIGRRFEGRPLVFSTIYKTFLFTFCVVIFNAAESMISSFIRGRDQMEVVDELISRYNYEWLAGCLVVFFVFIPFFALRELNRVMGEGIIGRLFFKDGRPLNSSLSERETRKENLPDT